MLILDKKLVQAGRLNDLSKSQSSVTEAGRGARTSNYFSILFTISFHLTFLYRRRGRRVKDDFLVNL